MSAPPESVHPQIPRAFAVVACGVLESEVTALTAGAPHIIRREFFEMGLHDQPAILQERLAGAIARAEDDPAVETVVLVYGLCGLAVVDLAPRRCPLVVPRAHDCLTLFLGSKEPLRRGHAPRAGYLLVCAGLESRETGSRS